MTPRRPLPQREHQLGGKVDILGLFRPLAEFEASVGELYERYSRVFAGDPEVALMFYRMAMEERGHVDLIEYQRRLVRKNPEQFSGVTADLDEIKALHLRVVEARVTEPPPALPAAVALAFGIETSAAEYHFRGAMRESNPATARLLESLGRADRLHTIGLQEFAQARGLELPGVQSS
jgi:hypothetical protein